MSVFQISLQRGSIHRLIPNFIFKRGLTDEQRSQEIGAHLCTSMKDALALLSSSPYTSTLHRCFVIGGASLYSDALNYSLPASADSILLTRVLSPAFECDVFMPEFHEMRDLKGRLAWERATHEELEKWVGFIVPSGIQEEKGVQYEFQLWTRKR